MHRKVKYREPTHKSSLFHVPTFWNLPYKAESERLSQLSGINTARLCSVPHLIVLHEAERATSPSVLNRAVALGGNSNVPSCHRLYENLALEFTITVMDANNTNHTRRLQFI